MGYGFVIDNRLCIGCHACTVACKSEHDIPLGVNRTHVKYIEKGLFPNNKREFAVHRCNHCADAPCVEICPTTALYTRKDGIVDFDNDRCIGCKSCMQACPYDALYIDPNTNTAAKCNYCAHRIDGGYEPACVIVCPVEAIVSGDLDDPNSKIATLVDNESVTVRKPEKGTKPQLYYVNGSSEMLVPAATDRKDSYAWSEQIAGVGHFAKYADERVNESDRGSLLLQLALENHAKSGTAIDQRAVDNVQKELSYYQDQDTQRVYDTPSKGVLWGWQVPSYIWTKAIAAGTFMILSLIEIMGLTLSEKVQIEALSTSLFFMIITAFLLIADLDRPDRFLYVLLRPNWTSWLVRGAYIISAFSGTVAMLIIGHWIGWDLSWIKFPGFLLAFLSAVYTAFLFNQAKARDHWQSPLLWMHMLIHSLMAGTVIILILGSSEVQQLIGLLIGLISLNLILLMIDILVPHRSIDNRKTIFMMKRGYFFLWSTAGILIGNLLPLLMIVGDYGTPITILAGLFVLLGIFLTEYVRVYAPQIVSLS